MFARLVRSRARIQSRSFASVVPESAVVARYSKNDCPKKVVSLVSTPLAQPKGEDVTIKMLFSPINPVDLNMIRGTYPNSPSLPGIGGNEGLGEVIAVGPKAKIQVGDLVFPRTQGFGTWRTHATVPESSVLVVPPIKGVQPEYLATMSSAPAAAWRMLHDFVNLKEGDVVIQNGANSMVGLSVVQICASMGVKTINIIRRRSDYPELVEKMKGYGGFIVCADDYIRTLEFRNLISDLPKPILALNNVGGPTATEMIRFLAPGGTLVTYGGMSVQPVTVATSGLIFNDVNLRGFWLSRWYETHTDQERLDLLKELTNLVQNQKLRLWTERHSFQNGFQTALDRAINSSSRDRKVLLKFE